MAGLDSAISGGGAGQPESPMNVFVTCGSGQTGYNDIMNANIRLLLFMALSLVLACAVPVIVTAATV